MPDPLLKETTGIVNNDPGNSTRLKYDLGAELLAAVEVATTRQITDPDAWTVTVDEDCRRATVAVLNALAEHIDQTIGWRQLYDLADQMERTAVGLPAGGAS